MNILLQSGVELMVVGMGIVFVFLAAMVGIINITAQLIRRFTPVRDTKTVKSVHDTHSQQQTIAAITAALHRYRENK